MKKALISFAATSVMLIALLGVIVADANSAYMGFGERNFVLPSYSQDSGEISGRILGHDYSIYFFDKETLDNIMFTAKRVILPFLP